MQKAEATITNDLSVMDLDVACEFIQHSYWGKGRSAERIRKSFEHSICFGALLDRRQVGFARVVSDQAFHAYIVDLFVIEGYRGRGIAKALMNAILDHGRLRDVTGFMLSTRTAHGFYEPFGFKTVTDPACYMVRAKPEP